jgi:hypothetical protein
MTHFERRPGGPRIPIGANATGPSALHRAARMYAGRGQRVLPIRERSKEPLCLHGVHDASSDGRTVDEWWERWPDANVAIAVPNAWLVLDEDPRNGGDAELARLEQRHGPLPLTVTARTGSGGRHFLFARPPAVALRGKLGPGLDVLGAGRYFLGAPSVHPCGGSYTWTSPKGTPIAQPPAWLLELARVRNAAPVESQPAVPTSAPIIERARAYVQACPPAISGSGGHNATFVLAQKLVRGFALSESEAFALMIPWNRGCKPPWSARELARKVSEASRAGRMPVGALADKPLDRRGG